MFSKTMVTILATLSVLYGINFCIEIANDKSALVYLSIPVSVAMIWGYVWLLRKIFFPKKKDAPKATGNELE
jgi:hypothetical protein